MRTGRFGMAVLMVSLAVAGCARITSQVVEKPRVDQELNGNRGYLVGTAPAPASHKATRQILQTDVELATLNEMTPWRNQKRSAPLQPTGSESVPRVASPPPVSAEESASASWKPQPRQELPVESIPPSKPDRSLTPSQAPTTYTVKSGDTLEKIAARVYGDSNQWHRIYQENKDRLASPNRIYPGQKLVIPPAQSHSKKHAGSPSDLK